MHRLVRLLTLLFVFAIVLGSTSVSANDPRRVFGGGSGPNSLEAEGCSGYCYPSAPDCFSSCYCEGSLSCCVGGCDWCCSTNVE